MQSACRRVCDAIPDGAMLRRPGKHGRVIFAVGEKDDVVSVARQGVAEIRHALDQLEAMQVHHRRSYYLLAEACGSVGEPERGLSALTEAAAFMEETGERLWEAEIHRLNGQLLLQCSSEGQSQAEASFRKALNTAERQKSRSLQLRAAASLARLWRDQGKRTEARDLLAPVYGWFTEGFDTVDLKDAKVLLDELA